MPRSRYDTKYVAYDEGYDDGYEDAMREMRRSRKPSTPRRRRKPAQKVKPTRKLSAWQKYIKQKKNKIFWKSGKDKGKLNFKKMGRAFRKQKK